jgi:predicted RecA/RadA family phage recombinase
LDNFNQPGDVLTLTAPLGGVVSGGVYQIGALVVVAAADALVDEPFEGKARGVFSVPKIGSQAWTEGARVYWDSGAEEFTTTAPGNHLSGVAVEAVGSGVDETTGKVYLDGIARADEST